MQDKSRPLHVILAAVLTALCLNAFMCEAEAQDVQYAQIGWWQIIYRETGTQAGCQAEARFHDQTDIALALVQEGNNKSWYVFVSNPKWNSWISRSAQHTVVVAAINPNKIWRGPWAVVNKALVLNASVDFVNSIADAEQLAILDERGRLLTALLDMKDSEAAIKAVVNCVRQYPPPVASTQPETQTPPEEPSTASSGTAFFVAPNLLVTANHVVTGCGNDIQVRFPDRRPYAATIAGQDNTNDLALLSTEMASSSAASLRLRPKLGEQVATFGFPYSFVLSSGGNFTLGNVTALSGMKDDSRFIQVSTPIQPGNSGGPLLDMSGNVLGVVESQLNAIGMMQFNSSVPQNINFAVQAGVVENFLFAKAVTPKIDSSESFHAMSPSDVADLAKKFTVRVYCEAAPPASSQVTPHPQEPTTTATQRAKAFVLSLEAKWSRPNAEALEGLEDLYDDEVRYYGKMTKRDDVIKEKRAFARKFPQRSYRPREPISVSCSDRICRVSGELDFRSVDPVAKIISEGVASFEYQLIPSGSGFTISLENGAVLSRSRTPLTAMSKGDASLVSEATMWQRPR